MLDVNPCPLGGPYRENLSIDSVVDNEGRWGRGGVTRGDGHFGTGRDTVEGFSPKAE